MGKCPHKYRKDFAPTAYDLCLLGYTDEELAAHFNVSRQSIANWKLQHAEFAQAVSVGKEIADAKVARSLFDRATGLTIQEQHVVKTNDDNGDSDFHIVTTDKQIPPDTKAAMHWLHNRQPGKWSRKVEVRVVEVQREGAQIETEKVIEAMEELIKAL